MAHAGLASACVDRVMLRFYTRQSRFIGVRRASSHYTSQKRALNSHLAHSNHLWHSNDMKHCQIHEHCCIYLKFLYAMLKISVIIYYILGIVN